jgi:hypothetical protein
MLAGSMVSFSSRSTGRASRIFSTRVWLEELEVRNAPAVGMMAALPSLPTAGEMASIAREGAEMDSLLITQAMLALSDGQMAPLPGSFPSASAPTLDLSLPGLARDAAIGSQPAHPDSMMALSPVDALMTREAGFLSTLAGLPLSSTLGRLGGGGGVVEEDPPALAQGITATERDAINNPFLRFLAEQASERPPGPSEVTEEEDPPSTTEKAPAPEEGSEQQPALESEVVPAPMPAPVSPATPAELIPAPKMS